MGPDIIRKHRKTYWEETCKPLITLLALFKLSIVQDFGSFLWKEIDLVEDDIWLVLDEEKSSFITYEIWPGIHTFKNLSEILLRNLQLDFDGVDNAIDNKFDDISMKTKMFVRPGIIAIRFEEKSFLNTVLGFNPHWD